MAKKHGITVEWYYGMGQKKVWYYHNLMLKRNIVALFLKQIMMYELQTHKK